jgi:general stress protein YciG
MFDRKAHCQRIASKGGQATVAKHGRGHMAEIGRRGFVATTCRYFLGDERLHKGWLKAAGAFCYWQGSGLTMKRDKDGLPVWPDRLPLHPAKTAAPGQPGLFERQARAAWDGLAF